MVLTSVLTIATKQRLHLIMLRTLGLADYIGSPTLVHSSVSPTVQKPIGVIIRYPTVRYRQLVRCIIKCNHKTNTDNYQLQKSTAKALPFRK